MATVEALQGYTGQISEIAAQVRAAANIQHQVVHGGPTVDVLTEGGLVPSLAKQAALGRQQVATVLEDLAVQLAGAVPYSSIELGLLGTVSGGYFSVRPTSDFIYVDLYRNDGGVAAYQSSYPGGQVDTNTINKGKAFPLRKKNRGGVTSSASTVFNNLILNIKVVGEDSAISGRYFRIAYFQNEANIGGVVGHGIVIEQFDAATYAATGTATIIHNATDTAPVIDRAGGVQTFVIAPARSPLLRFVITIDAAALPAAGTPINALPSGSEHFSWIVDPACQVRIGGQGDSLTINRGRVYPLRKMTRNGVTSPEPFAFSKAILNICIIGARPGKYYRLAYFVNGTAGLPGAKPDGWIIEEIAQENYATAENPVTTVINYTDAATPTITRDGIQTITLSSSVVQDLRILISLNVAELPAYGTPIAANLPNRDGYSYIIDPSRYIPAKSDGANSISINSAQIAPFRAVSRGGGVSTANVLQTMVILHARVINAKRGKYYGLRYFQNGNAAVVPEADNWIIEEVDIVGYDASIISAGTTIATLTDAQPAIDRTLGIQTILLKTKSDVRIEVTLDASKLQSYGLQYGMNFTPQNGYSYVIDPACYEWPLPTLSADSPKITYQVDYSGNVAFSWPDGVGTRGFEFGPNGNNSLANFRKVLRNGGVVLAMATDWAPPVTFEAANNGDGRIPLEFTGGNHLVNDLKTAQSASFVMEADGVPLKPGDSGVASKLVCYVINKLMANNTVSLGRYCLLQSLQVDFVPGAANVHADYLALEDLQMYIDYACQIVTTNVNDKLFYLGGQFPEPIDWDGKVNSGNAIDYPDAWAVITTSANGQLTAWIDREYGIAKRRLVDPVRGMIRGGGDESTKQYTTAYNRPLVRNPTTPNYIALAAGERYQWRGGYSWGPVDVKAGFVASTRYLDGDRIRRADAVSALAVLNP